VTPTGLVRRSPARRSRGGGRRWAAGGLAALGLVLAGCSSTPAANSTTTFTTTSSSSTASSSTTSSTQGSTVSTCLPTQLQVAPGQSQGAAGTIELGITFTNTSTATCTLFGYPGMLLLDAGGNPLATNVVRGGGPQFPAAGANAPATTVTLGPNQPAAFALSYSDVPVGNETSCPTSSKARITPPNDTGYVVITLQIGPCGGGTIHVSPVYPGSAA
jgi:hypothetical protein